MIVTKREDSDSEYPTKQKRGRVWIRAVVIVTKREDGDSEYPTEQKRGRVWIRAVVWWS